MQVSNKLLKGFVLKLQVKPYFAISKQIIKKMATFVISKRLNGFYKYELTSRKGKTIFTSNNFELRFECEEHIDFLKKGMIGLFLCDSNREMENSSFGWF